MAAFPLTVPGRSCGSCSLCCKLLRIDALQKPVGSWCPHCAPGRGGCTIYESRPSECRTFFCSWLLHDHLGPEWRPMTAKMVLYGESDGNRLVAHVDPGSPNAWRKEPYYSQLKEWACAAVESAGQVVVYIKDRIIVILPDKEEDLGTFQQGDHIVVAERRTPAGPKFSAYKVASADVPPEQRGKWLNVTRRIKSS